DGVISADSAFHILTIDTGPNAVFNAGTLRAADGGTLDVFSDVQNDGAIEAVVAGGSPYPYASVLLANVTVQNALGTVAARSAGATVVLSDATIIGGTIGGADGDSDFIKVEQ